MRLRAIVALLLCCSPAVAEIRHESKVLQVPAGLVEIRADMAGEPDCTWRAELRVTVQLPDGREVDARDPQIVDFRVYESGSVFVAYISPGQTLFVTSHQIFYDKRLQVITDYRVIAAGTGPPTPPRPPDPPSPTVPESVANTYGLGHATYLNAVATGDKTTAAKLSQSTASIYWRLHRGQCTGDEADAELALLLDQLPAAWSSFASHARSAYAVSQAEHGSGLVARKSMIREFSHALSEAGK